MTYSLLVIETTFLLEKEALLFSELLIKNKLALCCHVYPVTSVYSWKNKLEKESEYSCKIKLHLKNKEAVLKRLKENHSYEVPQVLIYEVGTSKEYFEA